MSEQPMPQTLDELSSDDRQFVLTFRTLCEWATAADARHLSDELIEDLLHDAIGMLKEGCSAAHIIHYLTRTYLKEASLE